MEIRNLDFLQMEARQRRPHQAMFLKRLGNRQNLQNRQRRDPNHLNPGIFIRKIQNDQRHLQILRQFQPRPRSLVHLKPAFLGACQ